MERAHLIGLVAAHPLVINGMSTALDHPEFAVVTIPMPEPSQLQQTIAQLPPADVYVVDLRVSTENPRALLEQMLKTAGTTRVLLVGDRMEDDEALELIRLGARGFVTTDNIKAQLAAAVTTVIHGGIWAPRALLVRALDAVLSGTRLGATNNTDTVPLSRREREVRDAVLQNLSNKEIAGRLHISERTVKFHVSNLLAKFQVRRRADLILLALQGARRTG